MQRGSAAVAKEVQGGQGTEGSERGSVRFGYVTERATEETQSSAAHLQAPSPTRCKEGKEPKEVREGAYDLGT